MSRLTGWWWRIKAFARRHSTVLVVLWMTLLGVGAVLGLRNEQASREGQFGREQVARQAQICDAFRRGQATDRLLIDTVLDDDRQGGGGVPLLDVEAYHQLPASVQKYVRELAAASAPPDPATEPPSLAERLATFRDENLGPDDVPEFCAHL